MSALRWLRSAASEGGIWLALAIATAALVAALAALPRAGVDTTPLSDDKEVRIVPSTGEQGFPVATFCEDRLTTVRGFLAPDSSGIVYQMIRVKDGVTESVVVTPGGATRYWDGPEGQQSEPAFVTAEARQCIADKVR